MLEINEPFVFQIVENELIYGEAMLISVKDKMPVISLNKDKMFRILAKRHVIIAALNKKFNELVETEIATRAKEEADLEKGK